MQMRENSVSYRNIQELIELFLLWAMTDEDSPTLGSVKSTFKNIMTTVISSTD